MKQLVIFDLDGTLLDTIADLGTAANAALAAAGYSQHSIQSYRMMVGNGVRRLLERAAPPEKNDPGTIDGLLKSFKEYYDCHLCDLTQPYQGIPDLLDDLHSRGVALAVASNKYEDAVKRLVAHFFPDIPFVAVCGNIDGVPVKPDPSIVFRVLTEHPAAKADVLYVGDSAVDIETARRACVDSAGVTWGFRPLRELTGAYADHIVTHPGDILDIVGSPA